MGAHDELQNADEMVEAPSSPEERLADDIAEAMEEEEEDERAIEERDELDEAHRRTDSAPVEEALEEELAEEDLEQDFEESLDVILQRTVVGEHGFERLEEIAQEEAEAEEEPTGVPSEQVAPRGVDEFVCRSCFLVKRRTQLADARQSLCADCVNRQGAT